MRVHTQLNYKRIQVDKIRLSLLIKTGSTVCSACTIITMCMKNADPIAAAWTQTSIDPKAHSNWIGHS